MLPKPEGFLMDRDDINTLNITYEEPEAQECQVIFLNAMCVLEDAVTE